MNIFAQTFGAAVISVLAYIHLAASAKLELSVRSLSTSQLDSNTPVFYQEADPNQHFCLVVGWSQNHHTEGMCMLKWLHNAPEVQTVYFIDMGISATSNAELRRAPALANVTFIVHNPASYMPSHAMSFERGHAGFKPIAMQHMLKGAYFDRCDVVWWADTSIRFSGRLRLSSAEQLPHPIWGIRAHSTAFLHRQWAHPSIYTSMGVSWEHDTAVSVQSGSLAMDLRVPHARQLLHMWAECSKDIACIMPPGASRQSIMAIVKAAGREHLYRAHRDDQTVLNLAMQQLFGVETVGRELTVYTHRLPFRIERHDHCWWKL